MKIIYKLFSCFLRLLSRFCNKRDNKRKRASPQRMKVEQRFYRAEQIQEFEDALSNALVL